MIATIMKNRKDSLYLVQELKRYTGIYFINVQNCACAINFLHGKVRIHECRRQSAYTIPVLVLTELEPEMGNKNKANHHHCRHPASQNGPYHCFGVHINCSHEFCTTVREEQQQLMTVKGQPMMRVQMIYHTLQMSR